MYLGDESASDGAFVYQKCYNLYNMFGVNPTGQSVKNQRPTSAGADGRQIDIQNNGKSIQWRFKGFTKWIDLVSIKDLTGAPGKDGKPGVPGMQGAQGNPGIAGEKGADGRNGLIGPTGGTGPAGPRGLQGEKGVNGIDGKDGAPGKDGREIQLNTSDTHIQWRYSGEKIWRDLIALSKLRGPQGDTGPKGEQGETGKRGIQGWGGPAGTKGDTGDTGAQGPPGPAGSGSVDSVVAGTKIDVDNTDPANPIVSVEAFTKADVGLGSVDNTSDADKPISTATQTALDAKLDDSQKGAANGLAELDGSGKVPTSQLPAYVDDVVMVTNFAALPGTGESGKIYVTEDTNITYRWNGSGYTEISSSLALGETSSTAYRGDRGKIAYDHSQIVTGNPHNVTKSEVGLGSADNTSDANKPVSTAQQAALDTKVDENAPIVPGTVGSATEIPIITYDAKGLITDTDTVTIASGTQRTFAFYAG